MTDDQRFAGDEEVVEAELVEDDESSAGPDSPEDSQTGAADQVERDLDELQHQRRPQTQPPDLVRERDE